MNPISWLSKVLLSEATPQLSKNRNSTASRRLAGGATLIALTLLLGSSGCDKLPIPGTETPAPTPTPAPAPKVAQPTPTPTPTPPVTVPQGPPPKTPDEIIADFMKSPTQTRGDQAILELAKLDEGHRAKITQIDANAAVGLTPVGLNAMKQFPNLQVVFLNQIPLRGRGDMTGAIGQLTHVETLSLHKTQLTDGDLAALRPLQQLKHLVLDDTDLTDQCFLHLKYLMSLERLDINGNLAIDGSGFAVFNDLKLKHPGLKVIQANKTRFGQKGFEAIHRSKSLEELYAVQCGVTDPKLEGLSLCPNLRIVSLGGKDQISDAGLFKIKLSAKPKLEAFYIHEALGITDRGLVNFRGCKKLQTLRLSGTSVTPAGLENLKKILKNTNVTAM